MEEALSGLIQAIREWATPLLAVASLLTLFLLDNRRKVLEIRKLKLELEILRERESRIYRPTTEEIDKILRGIATFAAPKAGIAGADSELEIFSRELYRFITANLTQAPVAGSTGVATSVSSAAARLLAKWEEVQGTRANMLNSETRQIIDLTLRKLASAPDTVDVRPLLSLQQYRDNTRRLAEAVANKDTESTKRLLTAGADPEGPEYSRSPLLALAASSGDTQTCRALIDAGARISAPGPQGRTPLIAASANGHIEVVRLLIDAGAPVDLTDRAGMSALMWAAKQGSIEM